MSSDNIDDDDDDDDDDDVNDDDDDDDDGGEWYLANFFPFFNISGPSSLSGDNIDDDDDGDGGDDDDDDDDGTLKGPIDTIDDAHHRQVLDEPLLVVAAEYQGAIADITTSR